MDVVKVSDGNGVEWEAVKVDLDDWDEVGHFAAINDGPDHVQGVYLDDDGQVSGEATPQRGLTLTTDEGEVVVGAGDWVLKSGDRFALCADEQFARNYQPA